MEYLTKIYDMHTKDKITLYFFYVNSKNEICSIKKKIEFITDGFFFKERQLYLIKENQFNLLNKHKLISLSYFNINIEKEQLKDLINDKIDKPFFKSLDIVDDIKFNPSLDLFSNINSVIYIYKLITNPENTTRRIILNKKHNKTRKL